MKIYVPWQVGGYYNGMHPLITTLLEPALEGVEWCHAVPQPPDVVRKVNDLSRANLHAALQFAGSCPGVQMEEVSRLLASRNALITLQEPDDYDLAFHHSAPWTNAQRPYVLHIEHILPLFIPELTLGRWRNDLPIQRLSIFQFTKWLLEHPNCRAVFTHMQFTVDQMRSVFRSPALNAKLHKVPLGVASIRTAPRDPDGTVRMLFTNSYYGNPFNFYERGALWVLESFLKVAERRPNVELLFYTALPDNLPAPLRDAVRSHPRIRHVDRHVSDEELAQAFASSDVFLLPALSIHSVSALRAMAAGLVCVATDVYGYGEYMTNGVDGILIDGVREKVSSTANDAGLLMDDYAMAFETGGPMSARLTAILDDIAARPDQYRGLRENAIRTIAGRFGLEGWRAAVGAILRASV